MLTTHPSAPARQSGDLGTFEGSHLTSLVLGVFTCQMGKIPPKATVLDEIRGREALSTMCTLGSTPSLVA